MTNELLEQWSKEAEDKYPMRYTGELKIHQLATNQRTRRDREHYIEGCKATHEKMLKIVEDAHKTGWGDCIMREYISNYESFLAFKIKHNIS